MLTLTKPDRYCTLNIEQIPILLVGLAKVNN